MPSSAGVQLAAVVKKNPELGLLPRRGRTAKRRTSRRGQAQRRRAHRGELDRLARKSQVSENTAHDREVGELRDQPTAPTAERTAEHVDAEDALQQLEPGVA